MKKIAPSILSADFTRLAKEIKAVEDAKADYIHIDVMDGHFVPNITVGPFIVEAVRKATRLPLDVHLMIENPDKFIPDFAKAGSDIITVHAEVCNHLHRIIQFIKEQGIRAGVSLNPTTPVHILDHVLGDVDLVLVMTVNPGFSGQSFIKACLPKIERVRRMLDEGNHKAELEVDGGIKISNIAAAAKAGADVFVSGSGIFGTENYKKTIAAMKQEIGA
ncbi:MAG TPA: ribulose-phosphate 3-epimerase [Deltaproteobacteria bacterium]|nr:MAG: ribulose-phosphate 3-epimerase [Deltaproteobacteria bacterium GWB2_42_7]OGP37929.1 MAG: ribulose-phosphate 3-epimerase [Deltaproteobacteria bacterium GWD2_42_10]HCY19582.1 ribulose-phosphate 3-epimerase [Deltaproteobacteria bacterium]